MFVTMSESTRQHAVEIPNLVRLKNAGRVPAPSRRTYAPRYRTLAVNMATIIFVNPFFLTENRSPRVIRSYPRNILMMLLLTNANSTAAAALRPRRPSDSQSTQNPVAKAMNIHADVLKVVGRHMIMAGSMVSTIYGPSAA
jgi:hypothetical protein